MPAYGLTGKRLCRCVGEDLTFIGPKNQRSGMLNNLTIGWAISTGRGQLKH